MTNTDKIEDEAVNQIDRLIRNGESDLEAYRAIIKTACLKAHDEGYRLAYRSMEASKRIDAKLHALGF